MFKKVINLSVFMLIFSTILYSAYVVKVEEPSNGWTKITCSKGNYISVTRHGSSNKCSSNVLFGSYDCQWLYNRMVKSCNNRQFNSFHSFSCGIHIRIGIFHIYFSEIRQRYRAFSKPQVVEYYTRLTSIDLVFFIKAYSFICQKHTSFNI